MKACPNCNAPLADNARFCTGCGANLEAYAQPAAFAQQGGFAQPEAYAPQETFAQQGGFAQPEAFAPQEAFAQPAAPIPEQPVMDSVAVPVIDDTTFAPQGAGAAQNTAQGYSQQGAYQAPQQFQQPQQPQFDPQGFTHRLNELNNGGYQQGNFGAQPYAQAAVEPGFTQPGQPMNMETPDYVNPASPQMPGTVPGKQGGSLIVPIILIILIIAVILVDVFWLFRKQIFGDDSSSETAAASIVTMADGQGEAYDI